MSFPRMRDASGRADIDREQLGRALRIIRVATGLDTDAIIEKLMQIESQPRMRVEREQALWEARRAGWQDIQREADALNAASAALAAPSTWIDADTAEAAIGTWVDAYDRLMDRLTGILNATRVARPTSRAEYLSAPLSSDGRIYEMYNALRGAAAVPGGVQPGTATLNSIGIATSGDGAASRNPATARLTVDDGRLREALASDLTGVQAVFTAPAGTPPEGVARLTRALTTTWRMGGAIDAALDGATDAVQELQRRVDEADARLARKREYYEKMFARLETMISRLNDQQASLSRSLSGLTA